MRLGLIIKPAVYFINSAKMGKKHIKTQPVMVLNPNITFFCLRVYFLSEAPAASNTVRHNEVVALEWSRRPSTAISSTSARDTRQSAFIAACRRDESLLCVITSWTNSNKSSSWKVTARIHVTREKIRQFKREEFGKGENAQPTVPLLQEYINLMDMIGYNWVFQMDGGAPLTPCNWMCELS